MAQIHPEDLPVLQASFQAYLDRQAPSYIAEYRMRCQDGAYKWLLARGKALWNEADEPVRAVGSLTDITQRKQAELALQRSEARLRIITDSIPGCISYVDADRRYQFVNQTYEAWFHCRRDEILGHQVETVIGPDAYGLAKPDIDQALAGEMVHYERDLPYPGGGTRHVSGTLVPNIDSQGLVQGYYALITDISDRKRLEQALQVSEQKTQEVFNRATAAIASMRFFPDGTWEVTRVSAGCERLTGFSPQELTDDNQLWLQQIYPEDWETFKDRAFADVFDSQTGTYEYRFRLKNGGLRWFSQTSASTWDDGQQCWVVTATSVDITDRKQAEEKLIEEFKFRQAIESSIVEGLAVVSLDGEQTYVNPAFCRMVGWEQKELLGANPPFVYWPPEEVDHITQALQDCLGGNRPSGGIELRFMRRHGERFDVMLLDAPLLDSQGNATAWLASVYDISDRKRADIALRENEERFRRAFDDAPIGMSLTTPDGMCFQVNQALCDFLGYSAQELMSLPIQALSHPEDMAQDQALMDAVLAGERTTFQLEKRYFHKQGHMVYGLLNASLVQDDSGQPLYFVAQIQDISERRRIERMQHDFICIVSHELRTPLTSMRGALGILETGALAHRPQETQRMMSIAISNTLRLIRLVNNILDLERLESGKVELIKEPYQIAKLMGEAKDGVEAMALDAQVTLEVMPLEATAVMAADAIVQTLTNLLSNAIKFSPADSTVWLRAELVKLQPDDTWGQSAPGAHPHGRSAPTVSGPPGQSYILFSVQDQGWGIPSDKLDLIFDRFQQVDASNSRQKGGSGLGLSICKHIVEQHGGKIWAESTLGAGSTFYFTLPMGVTPGAAPL
jgi:PAS domain S-box-containing protein